MYCSSKPRSLISIAILVIFILQTNLLKAHAHAIFEINNVSSSDGYVVLHLYENKTSFKKFNPDRIYKKVATRVKRSSQSMTITRVMLPFLYFMTKTVMRSSILQFFGRQKKVTLTVIHISQLVFLNMRKLSFALSMEWRLI